MIKYVQKDLGYLREPTYAFVRVEMPDHSWWKVPAQIVADSRDEHYRSDEEDTIRFIREGSLEQYDFFDWLGNNMNWDDVELYAGEMPRPSAKTDYQEGWVNGEKVLLGSL